MTPIAPARTAPPAIFDRAAVRRHRDRAARDFARFDFLKARLSSALVERLADINRRFGHALDLGCHTGGLASALLASRQVDHVTACDLSAEMVARVPLAGNLEAQVADEEALPFAPARFDLVASVMALHWTNDLPGALIQARHILKPDGLFMAAMIGGESLAELRRCLIEAEAAITGGASPRVSPFVDGVDAGQLLQRAGFAMPVSDTDRLTVRYRSILDLMHDLRGMGEAAAFSSPSRPLRRDVLLRAGEIYAARHGDVDGRLPARFDIVWLSGWAPAPGQPVPKRPGSATASLAQAVGATERPAGDPANPRTPDAAGD